MIEGYRTDLIVTRVGGSYDFNVCDVLLPDPLNTVTQKTIDVSLCPTAAFITLNIPFDVYPAVDISVIVVTSVGGRRITLPAVPTVSKEERDRAYLAASAQRISQCYALHTPWSVRFLVDPPDEFKDRVRQVWSIAGKVSTPTEAVVVRAPGDREILRVVTKIDKTFRVVIVEQSREISIEQVTNDQHLAESQIAVAQSAMLIEGELNTSAAILFLDSIYSRSGVLIAVHHPTSLMFCDLGRRKRLRVLSEIDIGHFRWVARRGLELIGKTEDGTLLIC